MEYNKPQPKKHRIQQPSGPRDVQRRIQERHAPAVGVSDIRSSYESVINELKKTIKALREDLKDAKMANVISGKDKMYTAEEFDSELTKHIEQTIIELNAVHRKEVNTLRHKFNKNNVTKPGMVSKKEYTELKNKLVSLESELNTQTVLVEAKNQTIEILKETPQQIIVSSEGVIVDPDRPTIEDNYIDPITKADEDKLESHIVVKDETTKDKLDDKVNKLKGLLGSLPRK